MRPSGRRAHPGPPTDLCTHAFAHALTSARREVDELAKIEAALSEVQKEADWLTWTQWQAQLHRLEQHAQCAASRTQARVVRQRLDQAVQHALRQHALQIQRLLQEEQPQKAYELASSVWAKIAQGVIDQHHFLQQLQHPGLPGWSQGVTQAIRDLKALRDFLRWTTTIEAQEQRVRDAITSNTPLDTIIQALDRLERHWHQAPPDFPHTPGPHYHALAARRREWRLIKRALDPLRELHPTRSRLDPVEERLRAYHDPLRQLADAVEQYRLEAHHTRDLFDTHLLPRAHDRVRQIIADVRQAWQAAEHHIASDTPDQVLQAWTTLLSLWQWSPRLAALCDDLDISTELPRPDVLVQRARVQAHAYLERLPQRVFSSSDQQHLNQLLGELDQVRLTVAGFPDAAQLSLPTTATATTLLDALTMAHSTLRRLLTPPFEPTSLHTYLSAVEEDFKTLTWHDESFAQALSTLRRLVNEVNEVLPPSPTLPHDDDDTSPISLLDRLIALERNPLIQRHRTIQQRRSRNTPHQDHRPLQQLLLYETADYRPPDHLPLAWWFDDLATPILRQIQSLVNSYRHVQLNLEFNLKISIYKLATNSARKNSENLEKILTHLYEYNDKPTQEAAVRVAKIVDDTVRDAVKELTEMLEYPKSKQLLENIKMIINQSTNKKRK
ncbi:MAG: hypothetical protein Q9O62_10315 [Ardenticatenia bacterium]|nr:hypothetical protein [Ardenticatenia bacterium]